MPLPPNDCILVIHTAFIGDLVLSTGFFSELRKQHPLARIVFVTTPAGAEVFTPNPWNLEIQVYDKRKRDAGISGFWKIANHLKTLGPKRIYCLHRSLRSSFLAKFIGGEIIGFQEAVGSFWFSRKVSRRGILFEVEKNLALLDVKGPVYPHLEVAAKDENSIKDKAKDWGRYVVISPSSVWATKRWPASSFGNLAQRIQTELGLNIVLVGSKSGDDLEISKAVKEKLTGGIFDVTGTTSLGELKAVIQGAELVISNDSSPLHIGLALGKKAVAVFGPTTKELGFFPYAPAGMWAVVEHKNLSCRPCGLHGHHKCPQGHFRCMLEVSVEEVFLEVKRLCP